MKYTFKITLLVLINILAANAYGENTENTRKYDVVKMVLVQYEVCNQLVPNFNENNEDAFNSWKEKNSELTSKAEVDPWVEHNIDYTIKYTKFSLSKKKVDIAVFESRCNKLVEKLANLFSEPDRRFNSPENTWQTFLSALRKGDKETVINCYVGRARKNFKPMFEGMSKAEMKEMADSFIGIEMKKRMDIFQESIVARTNERVGYVYFLVDINGNWKISDL